MSTTDRTTNTPLPAPWHSESGLPAPRRLVVADDRLPAATAHRLAREGTGLLWRGDYQGARQLLRALERRIDRKAPAPAATPAETFRLHRRFRAHRARVLGRLAVLLEPDHTLRLRRAPDTRAACTAAYGPPAGPRLVPLRELLGVLSAHQWRERGVPVPALDARVHPHYGVFAPVRAEYVDLVAREPLPAAHTAFDLGTGTGVLAAVLARRGVERVVATDISPRARACARDTVRRLGLAARVTVTGPDLFPPGRAALVVCNPPWLPGRPASTLEQGCTTPAAGCCTPSWRGCRSIWSRPARAGWSSPTWPSTWACGPVPTC